MDIQKIKELALSVCDSARSRGATFADLRITRSETSSALVQDRRADRLNHDVSMGVGLRVLVEEAWGFAGTDDLRRPSLQKTLERAVGMARASASHVLDKGVIVRVDPVTDAERVEVRIDPRSVSPQDRMNAILALEDASLKSVGSVIVNSVLAYGDNITHEVLVNTLGTCIEREIIRTSVVCQFVAADGSLMQRSGERFARRAGFELVESLDPENTVVRVAGTAARLLKAKRPPAGVFPVVFHPSVTGLLMHEALGHNAEADAVWAGESILIGKLGQKIADDKVTVCDDATYPDSYGTYLYDSEGVPAQKRVLIEKGVLKTYLHDLESAGKFGVTPNGAARAEDFMHRPIVRMSNTYMEHGTDDPAKIFDGIEKGIYLKDGSWGYVFVDKGQFTCHASEAQMIEHGKLGEPLRDVSVSGMMLETLMDIEAVADDFQMDKPGMCGKGGQSAPVNCGGPHVRVKKLVIGGV